MKTQLEALRLLLDAYVKMVSLVACEPGEKSHALWHSTNFIKEEIRKIIKNIKELEEY